MMALYPSRFNLDTWAKLGNKDWDFDALAPYFRKFATVHSPDASARDVCGMTYHDESLAGEGPVNVSWGNGYGPINSSWMESFEKNNLKMTTDPRSGKAIGAFQNGATIDPKTKTRSWAQSAYLTPTVMARKNLAVLVDTLVIKVVTEAKGDETVATGIATKDKSGTEKIITANKEVIVSAGALQSPQILELSGIGNKKLLESHGIPVVVDNPNVGEHLQDHPIVCVSYEVNEGVPSGDALSNPEAFKAVFEAYQMAREGPLGQSTISVAYTPLPDGKGLASRSDKEALLNEYLPRAEADQQRASTEKETALLRELVLSDDEPTIQYLLFPFQITIDDKPGNMSSLILPSRPEHYLTIMSILNHPFSRGSCHITSADASVKPEWDPKFNANPADLEMLARSVQFSERIARTAPFSDMLKPGGARNPEIVGDSLEDAREVVRQRQISVYHPSSSCAMLPKELGGVVDERLRVYGVKGLRVVDASVFPLQPLGNIQSTVYAVAEKAADMIKEDWR